MTRYKAEIYCDFVRIHPINNGYRPGIDFRIGTMSSGQITLINKNSIKQGEIETGYITLLKPELVADKIKFGEKYYFYEGPNTSKPVGYIVLLELLND